MLKIYGADLSAPANKVRFVANYLQLEYVYTRVSLRDGEHRREEFLKINPIGKIPVIDDDGFVLFESNAICRYLIDTYDQSGLLYPKDVKKRAIVDQWTDFISLHINHAVGRVIFNRVFAKLAKIDVDERSLEDGLKFLDRFLPIMENQLSGNEFVVGNQLTFADFVLISALDPADVAQIDLSIYDNIRQWRDKIKGQEFYLKCYKEYGENLKPALPAGREILNQ